MKTIFNGYVSKVEQPHLPLDLTEPFPVSIGDKVEIEFTYPSESGSEVVEYILTITTSTEPLSWQSGPLDRMGTSMRFEGNWPCLTCIQSDFRNPWQPSFGTYTYEQSDQSDITLEIKGSGDTSHGEIFSQGWLNPTSSQGSLTEQITFRIKYVFDSKILPAPTVTAIEPR